MFHKASDAESDVSETNDNERRIKNIPYLIGIVSSE